MKHVGCNLHFKQNISRQHVHLDGNAQHGIVLSVSRVVAFQKIPCSAESSSCEFGEVQVGEAKLLEGPASLQFLRKMIYR